MNKLLFHGDDVKPTEPQLARFHVIPVPYEKTVSYGHGTLDGPRAILEASRQLETFDGHSTPSELGIYTGEPVDCDWPDVIALANIKKAVSASLSYPNAIPCVLGGEHTISSAVVAAFVEKYGAKNVGVVHFDAHCDLRDTYDGTPWSHACVLRRVHETGVPLYQIGTRSYCIEERDYRAKHDIPHVDAETFCRLGPDAAIVLPDDFPENVFISFDIDALDSSIMPATGTPCPGGLSWWDAMRAVEIVTRSRKCVGFDLVEFAPIKIPSVNDGVPESLRYADFAAAQLAYNIMGLISRGRV